MSPFLSQCVCASVLTLALLLPAHAWVKSPVALPTNGEVTIVAGRFCLDWPSGWQLSTGDPCLRYTDT